MAIYRLPDAFVGAPIFGIDMAAAHRWECLFDAQFGRIPGVREIDGESGPHTSCFPDAAGAVAGSGGV